LEACLTLDPNYAEASYLSGVVFQRWQQPQQAFNAYKRASDLAPAELAYILAQAEMLVSMNQSADALTLLQEKVIYFEHSAAIRDAVGQLLMNEGRYSQAVEMLRQASILASDDDTIREHFALALFYNKDYRDAADVLHRLTKNDPYAKRADLITALGECQMQIGQHREARMSFETASQIDPSSAGVWLSLGKAAIAANDMKRAELSLRKSLSLQPNNSEAQLMLGYLRLRQDRLNDALAAFQKASALDRTDTVSLCMIGYVLEKLGRSEQGLQYYGQALQIRPNDELATRLMANVSFDE
jgi:tetratricopeptide (TPR) repeat protein